MKVLVVVREEHYKNQRRGDCYSCAVAQAINAKLAFGFYAFVFEDRFRIEESLSERRLCGKPLPAQIRKLITVLDGGENAVRLNRIEFPIRFQTDIPGKYLRAAREKQ